MAALLVTTENGKRVLRACSGAKSLCFPWTFQAGEDERRATALSVKLISGPQEEAGRTDTVNWSRKWRSKEGPAQAPHSWSSPLLLYRLNTASQDSLKFWPLRRCWYHIFWISRLLEPPDILQFWDSALAISWLPPALYDVCYSQAGRKAALSRGHRQWRRQTWPTTGGARGLLLEWVFILELDRSMG